MKLTASPSTLAGTVAMPGSKSHTIRAVAVASLAEGRSTIRSPLDSADARSAVACYRALGARINDAVPETWTVEGFGGEPTAPDGTIDVANSGTTLRIGAASAGLLREGTATFTGDRQIQRRPLGPLLRSLNDLGAPARSLRDNGCAPVEIGGRLAGGRTEIAAVTSQFLSALLINAPLADGDTEIVVTELNEAPYVGLTLGWLDRQAIRYEAADDWRHFRVAGRQRYRAFDLAVPADWSSATFFLVAAAITEGRVTLSGLDESDPQGDKAVVDYLRAMGAQIASTPDGLVVTGGAPLRGAELDLNATPDALPALAVAGCFAEGSTHLLNVPQARLKETDRIAVMASELGKLGVEVEQLRDGLIVHHGEPDGGSVHGHDDHRVVMAMALAGLAGAAPVTVDTAEAMAVTFPTFVELMRSLGAQLKATT